MYFHKQKLSSFSKLKTSHSNKTHGARWLYKHSTTGVRLYTTAEHLQYDDSNVYSRNSQKLTKFNRHAIKRFSWCSKSSFCIKIGCSTFLCEKRASIICMKYGVIRSWFFLSRCGPVHHCRMPTMRWQQRGQPRKTGSLQDFTDTAHLCS